MVKLVELEDMTRAELLALAKARGVALPAKAYVSHSRGWSWRRARPPSSARKSPESARANELLTM